MSENETSGERLARLKDRLVETELLAQVGAGFVNPNCLNYAKSLVKDFYKINDSGEFETTGNTPLDPMNLQPMPINELGSYLQEMHPYLFKPEASTGTSSATTAPPPPPNRAEMDLAARCAYIRAHGQAAYEALPSNPVEAKPLAERPRSTWTMEQKADFIHRFGMDNYLAIPAE